ncbi:hypothetical protein [Clostridium folliculivorans]|uniref:DUF3784 domain-containing protein n=1 Tax=Clostridium folliculivorans TaxID=2886038 RepID=A0A9W6DCQ8_9CLOT|nr:hypothetical protein [Clostridium folliculivorans]GKU27750.1 hypothetical protein CFOLD11_45770 [Clostridium folliculivorans]GKU32550.1 hypothetical protein CFB3_46580 [Clostridium folliculivorans]
MENIIFSVFLIILGAMIGGAGVRASDERIKNSSNFKKYNKVSNDLIKFLRMQNIVIGVALVLTGCLNFYTTLSTTILALIIIGIYLITTILSFVAKRKYL